MNYKHIFIVDISNKKALRVSLIIDKYCKEIDVDYKIIYVPNSNQLNQTIKSLGDGNIIYSVGEIETLREIVMGIIGSQNILNVIPIGSSKHFSKSLKSLPKCFNKIDLASVNNEYFINEATLSLESEIIDSNIKNRNSILSKIFKQNNFELELDRGNYKVNLMAICNGKYSSSNFKISSTADLSDGFLDVYMIKPLKTYQIPDLFLKLICNRHEQSCYIDRFCSDGFEVRSKIPLICNADGKIISSNIFNFKLLSRSLTIDNGDMIKVKQIIKKCKIQ